MRKGNKAINLKIKNYKPDIKEKKKDKKIERKLGPISNRTEADALDHSIISRLGTCKGPALVS